MTKEVREEEALIWLRTLLQIDTSMKNEIDAATVIQKWLDEEKIQSEIHESEPGRANLRATLQGGELPPLLMISHLDVVSANQTDWNHSPFAAEEEDEEIWARGALDTKQLTVMQLASLIELKRSGVPLNRDVHFIATADEESGSVKGMDYVTNHLPDWVPNGTVINEGGGFPLTFRGQSFLLYSAGEKGSCVLKLQATGQGGHASCPPEDQAVQKLAAALHLLMENPLPSYETEVAALFSKTLGSTCIDSDDEQEALLGHLYQYMKNQDIYINRLNVGTQINVIPYKAEAEVEFRILPGMTKDQVESYLHKSLKNCDVIWEIKQFQEGFTSTVNTPLVAHFQEAAHKYGFEGKLLPFLALGKTDGRFLRGSEIYGFSPLDTDMPFTTVLRKVHQANESISVRSFLFGTSVLKEAVKNYCLNE